MIVRDKPSLVIASLTPLAPARGLHRRGSVRLLPLEGVRIANRAFDGMSAFVGEGLWARIGGLERNDWLVAAGFAPLFRARREAGALGGEEMNAVLDELAPHQDEETLRAAEAAALLPVLPLRMEKRGVRVSRFTLITTFGSAQDVPRLVFIR